jgi:crotonobetainyl-CoA hydratase
MEAAEALRWGLVNRVVPAADVMAAARELADEVAASAPLSLAVLKEVFTANETRGIAEGYALYRSGGLEVYERMLKSEDAQEGPRAFTEKRPPVWKGR